VVTGLPKDGDYRLQAFGKVHGRHALQDFELAVAAAEEIEVHMR